MVTTTGSVVAATGVLATAAAGLTLGVLYNATQDPDGDPALKQAYLDHGGTLGVATVVSAGVLVVGGVVLVAGLMTE